MAIDDMSGPHSAAHQQHHADNEEIGPNAMLAQPPDPLPPVTGGPSHTHETASLIEDL
jgi:hypothetical protein